ncbi:hypothetical protein A2442_02810 [Candidatus Campbellbacteria bacterium RIFOXYC2_FULL_35_25]|uniref:Nudix hydrolase domain-containing protein n=1 Tax=Candidatus Campbellbacteria bacterium RIFOXYC2_FULL_35_25 TaxID=1797582 RepID=A0A1F5EJ28_9BACT|nr:MAG: hypothetical protein A2442_02810 [Candidatus Campbellbacteria bacterium RIFOXYC2_FULL_35_25]
MSFWGTKGDSEAGFAIIIKEAGKSILIIKDQPKNEEEFGTPKRKTPGGFPKTPEEKDEKLSDFVLRKQRDETGVSAIHLSKKDGNDGRVPLCSVFIEGHSIHFFLMRHLSGEPTPGENILSAEFFSVEEVRSMIESDAFLRNHRIALEYFLSLGLNDIENINPALFGKTFSPN